MIVFTGMNVRRNSKHNKILEQNPLIRIPSLWNTSHNEGIFVHFTGNLLKFCVPAFYL